MVVRVVLPIYLVHFTIEEVKDNTLAAWIRALTSSSQSTTSEQRRTYGVVLHLCVVHEWRHPISTDQSGGVRLQNTIDKCRSIRGIVLVLLTHVRYVGVQPSIADSISVNGTHQIQSGEIKIRNMPIPVLVVVKPNSSVDARPYSISARVVD